MNNLSISKRAFGMAIATVGILASVPKIARAATFTTDLTGDQVVPATGSSASGTSIFTLNEAETELAYTLSLSGVDLKADSRTAPTDVNKIHIHVAPPEKMGRTRSTFSASLPKKTMT